jgi:hypothetical protein
VEQSIHVCLILFSFDFCTVRASYDTSVFTLRPFIDLNVAVEQVECVKDVISRLRLATVFPYLFAYFTHVNDFVKDILVKYLVLGCC